MIKKTLLLALAATAAWAAPSSDEVNDRPLVGIFGAPWGDSSSCPNGGADGCEYIAASYVKWVESMGGRAVPIPYTADNATLETVFNGINAMLIPGGDAEIPASAYTMWDLAVAANDAGDHFPVWGTCMGFEWLVTLAGGALDGGFDASNVSLPLSFTDAAAGSRLYSSMDESLIEALQDPNATMAYNSHSYGITPEHFADTDALTATFTVLSTSVDIEGKPFVSSMEAPGYPFYGVQYHPEKTVYEWRTNPDGMLYQNIPHSMDAIEMTHQLAKVLLSEARKNTHKFVSAAIEEEHLIWQWPVYYEPSSSSSFVQVYLSKDATF